MRRNDEQTKLATGRSPAKCPERSTSAAVVRRAEARVHHPKLRPMRQERARADAAEDSGASVRFVSFSEHIVFVCCVINASDKRAQFNEHEQSEL